MAFREATRKTVTTTLIGLAVLFILAFIAVAQFKPQPAVPTIVTVTGIFAAPSKWFQSVDITYRSQDGMPGETHMPANEVRCRVGDTVPAERSGISVYLKGTACRKAVGSNGR